MRSIERAFLDAAFERYDTEADGPFASGKPANNKLNADRIATGSNLYWRINYGFADWVMAEFPDPSQIGCIVGLPKGGTRFAEATSEVLAPAYHIPVAYLKKLPDAGEGKRFAPVTAADEVLLRNAKQIAALDDVSTEMTTLRGFLRMPQLAGTVIRFCSAFHRGAPELLEEEIAPGVGCSALEARFIPNRLPQDSELWQHA